MSQDFDLKLNGESVRVEVDQELENLRQQQFANGLNYAR